MAILKRYKRIFPKLTLQMNDIYRRHLKIISHAPNARRKIQNKK